MTAQGREDVDDLAHAFLKVLRSAPDATNAPPSVYLTDAIERLAGLHAVTEDGELPQVVDGHDFRAEVARLFDTLRRPARIAVTNLAELVGDARSHELDLALEQRSALQFLADDFRGTIADGLIDDDSFEDIDDEFAEKLREHGPFDFFVPENTPPTHWWWEVAVGRAR